MCNSGKKLLSKFWKIPGNFPGKFQKKFLKTIPGRKWCYATSSYLHRIPKVSKKCSCLLPPKIQEDILKIFYWSTWSTYFEEFQAKFRKKMKFWSCIWSSQVGLPSVSIQLHFPHLYTNWVKKSKFSKVLAPKY